eukprot:171540-Amphidinium_carterae.1
MIDKTSAETVGVDTHPYQERCHEEGCQGGPLLSMCLHTLARAGLNMITKPSVRNSTQRDDKGNKDLTSLPNVPTDIDDPKASIQQAVPEGEKRHLGKLIQHLHMELRVRTQGSGMLMSKACKTKTTNHIRSVVVVGESFQDASTLAFD